MKFPRLDESVRMLRRRPWLYRQVRATMAPIIPRAAVGFGKVRIGAAHDGGYVMLDHFDGVAAAVSAGIGANDSWDLGMASQGIPVLQFDHTIDAAPTQHPHCRFFRQKIVPRAGGRADETAIETIVSELSGDLFLKMDIEGDEWAVLAQADSGTLARFRQIVCEFHGLDLIALRPWRQHVRAVLEKLSVTHAAVHLHANNHDRSDVVGLHAVPRVIEVTFLRRAGHVFADSREAYPTAWDRPNDPARPEMPLTGILPRAMGGRRSWR